MGQNGRKSYPIQSIQSFKKITKCAHPNGPVSKWLVPYLPLSFHYHFSIPLLPLSPGLLVMFDLVKKLFLHLPIKAGSMEACNIFLSINNE